MSFRLTPLGGLSQIGGNSMLIETNDGSIMIDYGILFPKDDLFDINYLIPNIEQLEKSPEALIITHGHEDHIGAIPHLIEKFPGIRIIAPKFAAELIQRKCDYYPRKLQYHLESNINQSFELCSLVFDYVKVNHSIPDTYGIHISDHQSDTSSFFISDFKIDESLYFESVFDFEKLKKLSQPFSNRLLMADSTNILSGDVKTPLEVDLIPDIKEILSLENQRVIATTFSSNIARIKTLINLAQESNRKVVLYGRSLQKYSEIAFDCNILDEYKNVHDIDQVDIENKRCLIIVSGCQADFKSTFTRIANDSDSKVKLKRDDIVMLSSKTIPGNEKNVASALNEIAAQGSRIITARDKHIHASGHAGKEDIARVFDEYKPTHHIPIHGETFFLKRHGEFIKEKYASKVRVIQNFTTVNYPSFKQFDQFQQADPTIIHAKGFELDRENIRERRKIASNGLICITVGKKEKTQVTFLGLTFPKEHLEEQITETIIKQIRVNYPNSEQMRLSARRVITNLLGLKPTVIIHEI